MIKFKRNIIIIIFTSLLLYLLIQIKYNIEKEKSKPIPLYTINNIKLEENIRKINNNILDKSQLIEKKWKYDGSTYFDREPVEMKLSDITPFEWDKVYFFASYINKEKMNEIIGYKFEASQELPVDFAKAYAFIKNGEVICFAVKNASGGEKNIPIIDYYVNPTMEVSKEDDILIKFYPKGDESFSPIRIYVVDKKEDNHR
jgi:hypothetical protein